MVDNVEQANDTTAEADWFVAPVEPDPRLGPFLRKTAHPIIRQLTKGNTQHIAMVLAELSPRDGKLFVVQERIANEAGRSDKAVRKALKELVLLGLLLRAKRTMGGFEVVWGKVAYGITEADNGSQGRLTQGENTFSDVKEIRDALRLDLRPAYCAVVVARHPKDLTHGSPEVRKLALLTDVGEKMIMDNLVFFATSQSAIPQDQICHTVLEEWMKSAGENNFLVRKRHPLQRFSEDVGRVVCRMLARQTAQPMATPEKQRPTDDSRRSTRFSAREIEENRRITAARVAALPKHLKPRFYTDTAA